MNIFDSFIFSLIQGITEFVPISSSGHTIIFQKFLKIKGDILSVNVAIHLGTVLSILTFYRNIVHKVLCDFFSLFKEKKGGESLKLLGFLAIGSLPAAVLGFLFRDFFKELFQEMQAVILGFFITGTVLFLTRFRTQTINFSEKMSLEDLKFLTLFKAFLIGLSQAFAIIPGVSRSGMTISTALFLNVPGKVATFFSFLLSIPVILGASLLEFPYGESQEWENFFSAVIFSYFFGLIGLRLVTYFVEKNWFAYFSYYLFILVVFLIFVT